MRWLAGRLCRPYAVLSVGKVRTTSCELNRQDRRSRDYSVGGNIQRQNTCTNMQSLSILTLSTTPYDHSVPDFEVSLPSFSPVSSVAFQERESAPTPFIYFGPALPTRNSPALCFVKVRFASTEISPSACFASAFCLLECGRLMVIRTRASPPPGAVQPSFQTGRVPPLFFLCCCLPFCLGSPLPGGDREDVQYHFTSFPMQRCLSHSAGPRGRLHFLRARNHVLSTALVNGRWEWW